jgi:homoserine kinase type II
MIRAKHLPFVPRVLGGVGGSTVFSADARVWDCCRWVPGEPRAFPTVAEVETACEAVARLHAVWATEAERGPCPGVRNRLRILAETEPLLRAGPSALPAVDPHLDPLLRRAVEVVALCAPRAARSLEPWAPRSFRLHPCVRDLRCAHVLFRTDQVSGVIDFGAVAVDHAAVDLARLLGDYAPADEARFAAAMRAYRSARPSFDAPDEFVRVFAGTGASCSLLGWLVRLVLNREPVVDVAALSSRLAYWLARIEELPRF